LAKLSAERQRPCESSKLLYIFFPRAFCVSFGEKTGNDYSSTNGIVTIT
jgi:hypothetical protein